MKRMSKIMMVLLVGSLASLQACGDDSSSNSGSDATGEVNKDADAGYDDRDADEPDADEPDADEPDADEPDAEVCTPTVDACSDDMCGEIDDGCGNFIDCGSCPCDAGVVQEESCGVCGLGERTCATDETGFGSCDQPSVPGVQEDADESTCESKLIFVDAAASGGDGSQASPFSTYADAVAASNNGQTIILGGQDVFQESLNIKKGVSVLGGFSSAPNFRYASSNKSRFEAPSTGNDDVFGITAKDIDVSTILARVEIETEDAGEGASNYGSYLLDSDKLIMNSVSVRAGKGGPGKDGAAGPNGSDGESGKPGSEGVFNHDYDEYPGAYFHRGPKGGVNEDCVSANGGDGGQSAYISHVSNVPAFAGEATSGADGGAGGIDVRNKRKGESGKNGAGVTSAGNNGGGGQSGGQIVGDLWVMPNSSGDDGQRGEHGHGGGGGGGSVYDSAYLNSTGSAGASGGAGGCGGASGEGGGGGGGSFGLLAVRSDVELIDSKFKADLGGVGGKGGHAGLGGRGGNGGQGGNDAAKFVNGYAVNFTLGWLSGNGGNGSSGSDGGVGGGGAGGSSYGIFCSQSQPVVGNGTVFNAGGSARGGPSSGNAGSDGEFEDSNCN